MREGLELKSAGLAIRLKTRAAPSSGLDERRLLQRIEAHDVDAFEVLYRLYRPRLARFLFNMVKRPQLVEEILDDTMRLSLRQFPLEA